MSERVADEIELVRTRHPKLQHGTGRDWVLIPDYQLPPGRYNRSATTLLFLIPAGYPITAIDNFFVETGLRFGNGQTGIPAYNEGSTPGSGAPPIPGNWGWFSWHPNTWRPAATIEGGDNLLTYLRGVNMCLRGEEA